MKKMIVMVIVLITLLGCIGMYKGTKDVGISVEESNYVIYKDIRLKPSISVVTHESQSMGNLIKVRAKFRNMSVYQVNAEVKIKFLDSSGYEIIDNNGWLPLILEKGEIKSLERIAQSPRAVDYRILIQYANR
ncbi:MAG: DUF1425 domain-containing protein [Bacteroidetes bacterium]|nr:DUF1425 domain-containing protein [Bacteroidota bacterium]